MPTFVASIDHGTTSTRFIVFDVEGQVIAEHQIEFEQIYPQSGCVSIDIITPSCVLTRAFV